MIEDVTKLIFKVIAYKSSLQNCASKFFYDVTAETITFVYWASSISYDVTADKTLITLSLFLEVSPTLFAFL